MTHDDVRELLAAAALEVLESGELKQVLTHTDGCMECQRLLAEYRELVAAMALDLPIQPMQEARSAAIRERVVARIRGGQRLRAALPRTRQTALPEASPSRVTRWLGWAVAASLAGVFLMHDVIHRPILYGWLVAAALGVGLIALGAYAWTQRAHVAALRERLTALEQETSAPEELGHSSESHLEP